MEPTGSRELSDRRARVSCKVCGRPVELARMRDHLRTEHQVDSAQLEGLYLGARVEARRARRSQRR
jgi:hypothetical protein